MHSLFQDIRFSLRLMRKRPGMTLLVISALIVGIGVNSAVFTVVNAVLIRPLPLPDSDRLVTIMIKTQQSTSMPVSYPQYLDWRNQCHSFQEMAAIEQFNPNLTGGVPERLTGMQVSASFFKVLGVPPVKGRDFTEQDDRPGANRVAIINHGLWERRFASDPAILGKLVVLNDQPYTIIGVAPANNFGLIRYYDIFVPNGLFLNDVMLNRNNRYHGVVARLKPGITWEQAGKEMEIISSRLAQVYPQSDKDMQAYVVAVAVATVNSGSSLKYIMVASSLILLLACVNVVTVFVANAVERRKELSVRLALGASRSALLRQFFVQGLIFATISGGLGLMIAKVCLVFLVNRFPYAVARMDESTIDGSVIFFTLATTLGASLLACILPSLFTANLHINSELKGDWSWPGLARYRVAGQSALIVIEVSLAFALTLVSALLIKSLYNIEQVDLGFSPERVLCFQVSLRSSRYKETDKIAAFYDLAIQKIRSIPGVRSASAASSVPLSSNYHFINLEVEGQPPPIGAQHPFVDSSSVMPGYFETLHTRMISGRDFNELDRANSQPVAVVDDVLAAGMWPGENPVGKRVRLADEGDPGPPWREVVGVVQQMKRYGPEQQVPRLQVYVPLSQQPVPDMAIVIDFQTDQNSLVVTSQKMIAELDGDVPIDKVRTLEEMFSDHTSRRRISVLLLGSFAAIGVLLGLIGIYGVVANSIVRMRREIAIRMALGATVRNAIILVIKLGLIGTVAGIMVGAGITVGLTKVLAAYLFGVASFDVSIYLLSAAIVFLLTVIASLIPAQSLLRFNPQEVLKE
ncbi:MAG TPA: ABC transporter permease [Candidatus Angelobacter sp.]|jgi:putative ABC transport system permease protein|nr:ABC transporter permease [Candidatus Angelobacter sp.]